MRRSAIGSAVELADSSTRRRFALPPATDANACRSSILLIEEVIRNKDRYILFLIVFVRAATVLLENCVDGARHPIITLVKDKYQLQY